jgi:hypothetical protein
MRIHFIWILNLDYAGNPLSANLLWSVWVRGVPRFIFQLIFHLTIFKNIKNKNKSDKPYIWVAPFVYGKVDELRQSPWVGPGRWCGPKLCCFQASPRRTRENIHAIRAGAFLRKFRVETCGFACLSPCFRLRLFLSYRSVRTKTNNGGPFKSCSWRCPILQLRANLCRVIHRRSCWSCYANLRFGRKKSCVGIEIGLTTPQSIAAVSPKAR